MRDRRESVAHVVGVEMCHRQEDGGTGPIDLADDRSRDEIARREISCRLVALDETFTLLIHQPGPLTAQCLRQQEPRGTRHIERSRMKLNELEISDVCTCLERHRNPIARGNRGVRRLAIDLTCATGCDQRAGCQHLFDASVAIEKRRADTLSLPQ